VVLCGAVIALCGLCDPRLVPWGCVCAPQGAPEVIMGEFPVAEVVIIDDDKPGTFQFETPVYTYVPGCAFPRCCSLLAGSVSSLWSASVDLVHRGSHVWVLPTHTQCRGERRRAGNSYCSCPRK